MHRALVMAVLVGCGQEYGISAVDVDTPIVKPHRPPARVHRPLAPQPVPLDERAVTLGGDAPSAVVDYLFVVDGSASMERVLGRVRDGFEALAGSGVFPAEARIAVMSTLPADPVDRR